jgi:hypothetical protein
MVEPGIPEQLKKCDICNADLGEVKMDTPLYCTNCMEEMEKLNMSPQRYKKLGEVN